jgi:hypothetical protein
VHSGQVVILVKSADQLALRDRMIHAVRHVIFARIDELDRRARHRFCDIDGVDHVIASCPPTEAAAQQRVVHLAFIGRQARCLHGRSERGLGILRAGPDLALVRGIKRRGIHRLHGGVILVRIGVDRLDLLRRL